MFTNQDLESRCTWNIIMNNPKSTTRQDVKTEDHPLYKCINCQDPTSINNECTNYSSRLLHTIHKLKKIDINYYKSGD